MTALERSVHGLERTWRMSLAVAAALVFVAGTAMAGQPSGTALVEAVDVRSGTVVLLGETYRMTASTHFVDTRGRKAELSQLRAMPAGALVVSPADVDAVRWKASETRTGWVLEELQIIDELPD